MLRAFVRINSIGKCSKTPFSFVNPQEKERVQRMGSVLARNAKETGNSSRIFDDLDLGSTRKPGPKAKLLVPMKEGGLVRLPREVRGR